MASNQLRVETRSDGEELLATLDAETAVCVFVRRDSAGLSVVEIGTRLRLRGLAIPVIAIDAENAAGWQREALQSGETGRLPACSEAGVPGDLEAEELPDALPSQENAPLPGPDALPMIQVLRERFR